MSKYLKPSCIYTLKVWWGVVTNVKVRYRHTGDGVKSKLELVIKMKSVTKNLCGTMTKPGITKPY